MAVPTAIEWTEETWNPTVGCSKVSPGCRPSAHCYAETLHRTRLDGSGVYPAFRPWTPENAEHNVTLVPERLELPLKWRKPRMVFVNSMSDLFHELIPDSYIDRVFATMALASRHTFQVLTKRPERMAEYFRTRALPGGQPPPLASSTYFRVSGLAKHLAAKRKTTLEEHWDGTWPLPNVWFGVSIENRRFVHRADYLRETPAVVRFISAEPLLGPLVYDDGEGDWLDEADASSLVFKDIDWLICGGESGPEHRRMDPAWARMLRDCCRPSCGRCERVDFACGCDEPELSGGHTAFFMKQMSGLHPGDDLEELPEDLRIREFPQPAGVPV